jgi:hypothetical protein
MGSILSTNGPSDNPGTVHLDFRLERQLFDFKNDLVIAWLPNQFREQLRFNVFAVIGHPPYGFNLPKIDDAGPI